jgi:hypothetical protein
MSKLIEAISYTLNMIPRTRLQGCPGRYRDSYQVAAALDKARNGEGPGRIYSQDEMEAALCIWEAVLDVMLKQPTRSEFFGEHGSWDIRIACGHLAAHCERIWQAFTNNGADDTVTFDWEFVPAYVAHCVDWKTLKPKENDAACLAALAFLKQD